MAIRPRRQTLLQRFLIDQCAASVIELVDALLRRFRPRGRIDALPRGNAHERYVARWDHPTDQVRGVLRRTKGNNGMRLTVYNKLARQDNSQQMLSAV